MEKEAKETLKRCLEKQLREALAYPRVCDRQKKDFSESEPDPSDRAVVDSEQFFILRFK